MSGNAARPKVSVCVATYNQRAYIKDCLLSVLMQSYDVDLEVLVGDDCSTDGTSELVREIATAFPGRLIVLHRERNIGPFKNFMDLTARATGEFIANLDGDDYWMPGKLAAQLEFFQAHPDCAAVYTNAHIVTVTGELIGAFSQHQPSLFDTDYLLRANFLNFSSMLYRSNFKSLILGIDRDCIDYRMHLRLSRHGKMGFVNQGLVVYRSGTATSMMKNVPDKVQDMYWDALCDPEIADVEKSAKMIGIEHFFAGIAYQAIKHGRISYALQWVSRIRRELGPRAYRVCLFGLGYYLFNVGISLRRKLGDLIVGR